MSTEGGLIASVTAGGFAERAGLRCGDRLLAINGQPVRDVIDVRFYGSEEELVLAVRRGAAVLSVHASRGYCEDWGGEFADPLFDGIRSCANHCPFCFVAGLPPGLRPLLYVRDDDYRLSFLSGSFVTLTNLEESDWERLAEQRLSPLYVSVQATDPDLRRRLLGGWPVPDIREQIRRLGEIGITVHAQVVICPGLNDGAALEQTVSDLWALRHTVGSVALVPVGLTRHHPARLRRVTPGLAREVLAMADRWRRLGYREVGRRFVYPSDEIYLLAGRPIPGAATYDGFPQIANGVGLLRRFLDDWARLRRRLAQRSEQHVTVASVTLASGTAMAPYVRILAQELAGILGISITAIEVPNCLFGPEVTVAGLLTGRDVVEALGQRELGEIVILPRTMFDAAGERTLDDWTLPELARALGTRLATAASPSDIIHALSGVGGASAPLDSA